MLFRDRAEAGRVLGSKLKAYAQRPDVLVLALPRGGVPVGYEIARALGAGFDVFLVRKLGLPGREELAMGAIASGGVRVINQEVVRLLEVSPEVIERVAAEETAELARREHEYRDDLQPVEVKGKTVILVDDGLATGSTMRAAVAALRRLEPSRIVVAVPVAAPDTLAVFQSLVDDVVCLQTPEPFRAVGLWYRDFSQISDAEVRALLHPGDEVP
jgi:putative phosphoribosyl transferase